jgi:hypothetical protein
MKNIDESINEGVRQCPADARGKGIKLPLTREKRN